MGKHAFLDALKRAMSGLPPEAQAKTLAYYEQRFIDGLAAGRSETEIAQDLDDPKKIALTLRTSTHLHAFEQKPHPGKLLRLMVSALGLAIFNLFMVVPAIVYASLLAATYACAFAFYLAGIAITAGGLSGANELVLEGPLRHFVIDDAAFNDAQDMQTKVSISDTGIHIFQEKLAEPAGSAADAGGDEDEANRSERVMRRAEAVAEHGVQISTGMDADSRTTQTVFGLAMVLGGIVLFLLSLVVTKYTFIGIKRYIDMNLSLLKGS